MEQLRRSDGVAAGAPDAPLRLDAVRNRASILTAAAAAFASGGIEVPLSEVARRAGVGIATLYRRFPDRESLINAVFEDKMAHFADLVDTALGMEDAWDGFAWYLHSVAAMQRDDHGFMNVLTTRFPPDQAAGIEAHRNRAFRGFHTLVRRAKATGRLRADFSETDLPMLLMANAGIIEATSNAVPEVSARFLGYMLDAFGTGPTSSGLPTAPVPGRLHAAMAASGGCAPASNTGSGGPRGP
ncbi:hypothetical protein AL755_11045 [Arthrobacter sp. ERGS1:01]|uniref:TetR/AcrR family transcriptional regulator n=1 Tax=Arthrobacter sp. ERGS1:01 TaxID=1704044 RepID=UPI0006CB5A4C|nr:TetR/AcrR family transcriptional regulator [Arthrobacter sp. ERGS1:01]ALE05879.1 hypothetical protein AL755_11045 [Arthrobacter sp. ERGS1:01]